MADHPFEKKAGEFLQTLQTLTQIKGGPLASLLANAKALLRLTGYDNWDGGIDLYCFDLSIPAPEFVKIEEIQDEIEKDILGRVQKLARGEDGVWITEVVLRPRIDTSYTAQDESDTSDLWKPNLFRLFISHHSTKKVKVEELRDALEQWHISGFVAHADIEPTLEWQGQIESALRTMDGLLAVLSPEFLGSSWCDQEVGYAMGRGKLVIPMRAGADPHGFIGKFQGLQGKSVEKSDLCLSIFRILAKHEKTKRQMSEVVVSSFLNAWSWELAKRYVQHLEMLLPLDGDLKDRLAAEWQVNDQITGAFGVPAKLKKILQ